MSRCPVCVACPQCTSTLGIVIRNPSAEANTRAGQGELSPQYGFSCGFCNWTSFPAYSPAESQAHHLSAPDAPSLLRVLAKQRALCATPSQALFDHLLNSLSESLSSAPSSSPSRAQALPYFPPCPPSHQSSNGTTISSQAPDSPLDLNDLMLPVVHSRARESATLLPTFRDLLSRLARRCPHCFKYILRAKPSGRQFDIASMAIEQLPTLSVGALANNSSARSSQRTDTENTPISFVLYLTNPLHQQLNVFITLDKENKQLNTFHQGSPSIAPEAVLHIPTSTTDSRTPESRSEPAVPTPTQPQPTREVKKEVKTEGLPCRVVLDSVDDALLRGSSAFSKPRQEPSNLVLRQGNRVGIRLVLPEYRTEQFVQLRLKIECIPSDPGLNSYERFSYSCSLELSKQDLN